MMKCKFILNYLLSVLCFILTACDKTEIVEPEPQAPIKTSNLYLNTVQPILNNRCIACHGCLGSPCNVKLTSFQGLERGAFGVNPYALHLEPMIRTSMNALPSTQAWRKVGFYPIVSRDNNKQSNYLDSLLYQLVHTGYVHNQPGFSRKALMPTYKNRYNHTCIQDPQELKKNLKSNPERGMPYGLPALQQHEIKAIKHWLAVGAPGPDKKQIKQQSSINNLQSVARWEAYFNDANPKQQLVSRYIFDHVYLATIVLKDSPGDFFKLVRSKIPGNSVAEAKANASNPRIDIIDTAHPYDNPMSYAKTKHFYYRLQKMTSMPVQKKPLYLGIKTR